MLSVNLSVNWGAIAHIDLEPASCEDEACELDHGYTGAITAEPLTLRVSEAADGAPAVSAMMHFADALSAASTRR